MLLFALVLFLLGNLAFVGLADKTISDEDVTINAETVYYLYDDLKANDEYHVEWNVKTAGAVIDFFICDKSNYDLWAKANTRSQATLVVHKMDSTSDSVDWTVPADGEWRFCFVNWITSSIDIHIKLIKIEAGFCLGTITAIAISVVALPFLKKDE